MGGVISQNFGFFVFLFLLTFLDCFSGRLWIVSVFLVSTDDFIDDTLGWVGYRDDADVLSVTCELIDGSSDPWPLHLQAARERFPFLEDISLDWDDGEEQSRHNGRPPSDVVTSNATLLAKAEHELEERLDGI